jgi:hypothetical protein
VHVLKVFFQEASSSTTMKSDRNEDNACADLDDEGGKGRRRRMPYEFAAAALADSPGFVSTPDNVLVTGV